MDYCRVDLCIAGGLTEVRKIAGWCETHYIHLAPHNPLGPVSTAACLHLCLASSLVGVQELPRAPSLHSPMSSRCRCRLSLVTSCRPKALVSGLNATRRRSMPCQHRTTDHLPAICAMMGPIRTGRDVKGGLRAGGASLQSCTPNRSRQIAHGC